ncbi:hypothetical protein BC829DRAFT_176941 [Chytridium lagenaria]|nr:hypothetical protein BC829DRAFT_176941 [Chytridium lagenaria]
MSKMFYVQRCKGTTINDFELPATSKIVIDGRILVSNEFGEPPPEMMAKFTPDDWVPDRHEEILEGLKRGPVYVGVLKERGTDAVVGMLHGGVVRHDEDFADVVDEDDGCGESRRVELWTISIKKEYMKLGGLGGLLMEDFFEWVRETSISSPAKTTVMVISFACNLRARRFYEKHGMRCALMKTKVYAGRAIAIQVSTISITANI